MSWRIVQGYPERILAIYIRDVTDTVRSNRIQAIVENGAAADHAVQIGLIPQTTMPQIIDDKVQGDAKLTLVEELL